MTTGWSVYFHEVPRQNQNYVLVILSTSTFDFFVKKKATNMCIYLKIKCSVTSCYMLTLHHFEETVWNIFSSGLTYI